jgi:hypothetical protein
MIHRVVHPLQYYCDIHVSDPIPAIMAYPNATESPTEFLKHLQSLELELATQAFQHFQKRPIQGANVRLDAPSALQWGERMDTLLVTNQLPPVSAMY